MESCVLLMLLLPSVAIAVSYNCDDDQMLAVQSFGNSTIRMHCQRFNECGFADGKKCVYHTNQSNCEGDSNFVARVDQLDPYSDVQHTCCKLQPMDKHKLGTSLIEDCFNYDLPDGVEFHEPKLSDEDRESYILLQNANKLPEELDGYSGYRLKLFLMRNKPYSTMSVKKIQKIRDGYHIRICRHKCRKLETYENANNSKEIAKKNANKTELVKALNTLVEDDQWFIASWSAWSSNRWTSSNHLNPESDDKVEERNRDSTQINSSQKLNVQLPLDENSGLIAQLKEIAKSIGNQMKKIGVIASTNKMEGRERSVTIDMDDEDEENSSTPVLPSDMDEIHHDERSKPRLIENLSKSDKSPSKSTTSKGRETIPNNSAHDDPKTKATTMSRLVLVQHGTSQNSRKKASQDPPRIRSSKLKDVKSVRSGDKNKLNRTKQDQRSGVRLLGAADSVPVATRAAPILLTSSLRATPNCFSGDVMVYTPTGQKMISELKVGDYVLIPASTNVLKYEQIELFYHREPETKAVFVIIETESGRSLSLTELHLIPYGDCDRISQSLNDSDDIEEWMDKSQFAYKAAVGECVFTTSPDGLFADRIVKIGRKHSEGIYSPMTAEGTIVTNGILASCFSQIESHFAQKIIYKIFIQMRQFIGFFMSSIHESVQHVPSFISSIHYLSKSLVPFAEF